MTIFAKGAAGSLAIALLLALGGCGEKPAADNEAQANAEGGEGAGHSGEAEGLVKLTPQQIRVAGIELVRPAAGGGGAITLPATIEGDPQATQVVSAAIAGRVVALNRNLGQPIGRGETLAVIESREAASLNAEVEAARARAALAQSNLKREERLFAQRVSAEQDLIAARTAATEASIALRLARQQVSAAGAGGGGLNRLGIVSPLSGRVIARSVVLGQTVAADAELFRVANLSKVALTLSLSSVDASRVRPGTKVDVSAAGRSASARISFVSPVLDETTKQVQALAAIDNRAGEWRVGEPVTATILPVGSGGSSVSVPGTAIQTVENRSVVFVRTADGFKVVPVTIGDSSGGRTIVTGGLTGREQIAAANSFILKAELGKGEAEHEDH